MMSRAGQLNGWLAGVIRTADRVDDWVRRRVHATDLRIALIDRE